MWTMKVAGCLLLAWSAVDGGGAPPGWRGAWFDLMSYNGSTLSYGKATGPLLNVDPPRPPVEGMNVSRLRLGSYLPPLYRPKSVSGGDSLVHLMDPGWCVLSNVCMRDQEVVIIVNNATVRQWLNRVSPQRLLTECMFRVGSTEHLVKAVHLNDMLDVPFLAGNSLVLEHFTTRSHPAHFADHLMALFTMYSGVPKSHFPHFKRFIYGNAPPPTYDLAEHLFNVAMHDLADPSMSLTFGFPRMLCFEHVYYPSKSFPRRWLSSWQARNEWLESALPLLRSPMLVDSCGPPSPAFLWRKEEQHSGDAKVKLKGRKNVYGLELLEKVFRAAGLSLDMVTVHSRMTAAEQAEVFRKYNLMIGPHTSQRLLCMYARKPSAHVELLSSPKVWADHWEQWCKAFGHEFNYAFNMIPWVPNSTWETTKCLMSGSFCDGDHSIFHDIIIDMAQLVKSVNAIGVKMTRRCPAMGWERVKLHYETKYRFPHPRWRPMGPWSTLFRNESMSYSTAASDYIYVSSVTGTR